MDIIPSVTRENWKGQIPVSLALSSSETAFAQREFVDVPLPVLYNVSRNLYLHVVASHALDYFKRFFETNSRPIDEAWFEFEGKPLKWNLPVGVLFDSIFKGSNQTMAQPWQLTVRFTEFPEAQLMRCPSYHHVRVSYFNDLKQGMYLKHGTTQPLMKLAKNDQESLWEAFERNELEPFWTGVSKMFEAEGEGLKVKKVPVRVVRSDGNVVQLPVLPSSSVREVFGKDVVVAGVDISEDDAILDANVLELSRVMSHPDSWMYLISK